MSATTDDRDDAANDGADHDDRLNHDHHWCKDIVFSHVAASYGKWNYELLKTRRNEGQPLLGVVDIMGRAAL